MNKLILLIITLFLGLSANAQDELKSISGRAISEENEALSFANIVLYNSSDSSVVKVEYTNDEGNFKIFPLRSGKFYIEISYVGYNTYYSELLEFNDSDIKLGEIILTNSMNELEEVTVTAKRPLLEVKPDKTVFNVAGSINASGSDAMELLRKAPGVIVDNNDNIVLLGKSGVKIYIDGRKTHLSIDELATMLKNMSSEQIDAIEIITNPSAKYDAEGNAGIINIRLIKNENIGTNGSISAGYKYGIQPKYNANLTLNHRNAKFNVFGNIGYYNGIWENKTNFYRVIGDGIYDLKNTVTNENINLYGKIGADYFIDKKNTIGFIVNTSFFDGGWNSKALTIISNNETKDITGYLDALSMNDSKNSNNNINLNYLYKGNNKSTLNIDLDYGRFDSEKSSHQPNDYYNADKSELIYNNTYETDTPTKIDIFTAKADYEREFLKGTIEFGAKSGMVTTDNTFEFYNVENSIPSLDSARSNRFTYHENVNAGYLSYSRPLNKQISMNFGIRMEQSKTKGELNSFLPINEEPVERDYIDWFPSFGVSWQVDKTNALRLNYSRRIDRPNYQELNPFEFKVDELTYQKGNPFLKPQYSNIIRLGYTYKYSLNVNLSYTKINDYSTRIFDTTEVNKSFITWKNLESQEVYSLSVGSPIPINEWWNTYINISAYYQLNKADFGVNRKVELGVKNFSFYGQNTFRLPKEFSLELSGFYNSPSIWGGTFATSSMWGMDIGVQKKILKDKMNIKLALSDIFKTQNWSGVSNYAGQYMEASGEWESHLIKLNISYNFGNNKLRAARKRKTGIEEESKRIKS